MGRFFFRAVLLTSIGAALFAQEPPAATGMAGVDLAGLTAAQKTTVLKLLNDRDCGCTCGMKVAECRKKDPGCSYSKGLAGVIVAAIKSGKTESEALEAAEKSQWAHMPEQDTRILGDPVHIPVAGAPVTGAAHPKITLVEFSDFQCPYCILAVPELEALLKAYPGEISLTFKQFPLDTHSQAAVAAAAALAAQKQGKFWEMHDALFAQHGHLSEAVILKLADSLHLDQKRFAADLKSPEIQKTLRKDMDDGEHAGVNGTPTIFVNGQRYNGAVRLGALKPVVEAQLKLPAKPVAPAAAAGN